MRTRLLATLLLFSAATCMASGRVLTPLEALGRRGQLVTLQGEITGLGGHPSGLILRVGSNPSIPVLVPNGVRPGLHKNPSALVGQTVQVTGFVSNGAQPVALRVGSDGQLNLRPSGGGDVQQRVASLERVVERLAPRLVAETQTAIVISSTRPTPPTVIPRASTQNTVLAYRGVPSRVEWAAGHRVLYYGRAQYRFDEQGQLLDVQSN